MRSTMHAVVLMTFAGLFVPSSANAQSYTYTAWYWSAQYSYYYRKCTFENGYYFYAMYKPSFTKNYIFCYNPYRQRYWCACPTIYHPSFNISSTFISIFIVITNVNDATTVENSAIPDNPSANTQNKVGMKNANGEPVATLNSMPTDLPAGLGSNVPSDSTLLAQRDGEVGSSGSGIFDVATPPAGTVLRPVTRVPRKDFGVVGPFPLQMQDLPALLFPDTTRSERQAVLEGLTFFTTPHTAKEGLGPINNQAFCLGCHLNTAEGVQSHGLLSPKSCIPGSTCVSHVSRARVRRRQISSSLRSCPPPGEAAADNLDAINDTGRTAAFTVFGDFDPSHPDTTNNPTGIGFYDPLDGTSPNIVTGKVSQPFGGQVQHTRPAVAACVPKPIPPVEFDANLAPSGPVDPTTGLYPSGFRRSVGERAGPPYIGRGLMEAVPTADILANADPDDAQGHNSSLGNFAASLGCRGDCISGRPNMIPRMLAVNKDANGNLTSVTGFVGGVGRFGLRANGVEILQFVIGGLQGELSFTSLINGNEIAFPTLFPSTGRTTEPAACMNVALHFPRGAPLYTL